MRTPSIGAAIHGLTFIEGILLLPRESPVVLSQHAWKAASQQVCLMSLSRKEAIGRMRRRRVLLAVNVQLPVDSGHF